MTLREQATIAVREITARMYERRGIPNLAEKARTGGSDEGLEDEINAWIEGYRVGCQEQAEIANAAGRVSDMAMSVVYRLSVLLTVVCIALLVQSLWVIIQ